MQKLTLALAIGATNAFMPASVKRSAIAPLNADSGLAAATGSPSSPEPWFPYATATFGAPTMAQLTAPAPSGKQDFLEAKPYFDQSSIPINTFKAKAPFTGKIVSVKRIVGPKATGETCDVVIDTRGEIPYWEGQSFGELILGCICFQIKTLRI
jgi:ferredoxin--NADP+ reductase